MEFSANSKQVEGAKHGCVDIPDHPEKPQPVPPQPWQDSTHHVKTGKGHLADLLRFFGQEESSEAIKVQEKPAQRRLTESTASLSDDESQDSDFDILAPMSPTNRADDPFLYYSSDKRRLEHLLGMEIQAFDEQPVERKTRISFEVDPFFNLMNSFPELLG